MNISKKLSCVYLWCHSYLEDFNWKFLIPPLLHLCVNILLLLSPLIASNYNFFNCRDLESLVTCFCCVIFQCQCPLWTAQHMCHTSFFLSLYICMQSRAKHRISFFFTTSLPATIESFLTLKKRVKKGRERNVKEFPMRKIIFPSLNNFPSMSTTEWKNCHQELNYGSLNTCDIPQRIFSWWNFLASSYYSYQMIKIIHFIRNWLQQEGYIWNYIYLILLDEIFRKIN